MALAGKKKPNLMSAQKGNVLVIGSSGVGKSTLINAVLGTELAKTGHSTKGVTKNIQPYETEDIPFRLIDTAGFEPSFLNNLKVAHKIKKDLAIRVKGGDMGTSINAIWFCVDGTSSKLFPSTVRDFLSATADWSSVPIIVVITKSYSSVEQQENARMIEDAFRQIRNNKRFPHAVLPVVAKPFSITEDSIVPPNGVSRLIEITNSLLPEGKSAAQLDISRAKLDRKRLQACSTTGLATASAAAVGAIPIPFADAVILTPLETGLIKSLASIYEIPKNDSTSEVLNIILEAGTIGTVAKAAIGAIKAIPGINLAASLLNAIVAGSIVIGLGTGCSIIFEKIYTGEKSPEDVNWIKQVMDNAVAQNIVKVINGVAKKLNDPKYNGNIQKILLDALKQVFEIVSSKKDNGTEEG